MPDMALRFSVIIPTYNRPKLLLRCLRALAMMDYPRDAFEVVVANNGVVLPPRDELGAAAGGITLSLISLDNIGPAAARNAAAVRAKGEYFALIDDDSAPAPEWLSALDRAIRANPGAMIGGRTLNGLRDNIYSEASQLLLEYLYGYYGGNAPGRRQFFASNNMAIPASIFREMRGFDGSFERAAEDREFCERWQKSGRSFWFAEDAVVLHAHDLDAKTFPRQHFNYGRSAFAFRRKVARIRSGRVRVEPLPFYLGMLRFPYQKQMRKAATFSLLLGLSQLANAGGFFFEAVANLARRPLAAGQTSRRGRRVEVDSTDEAANR